MGDIYQDMILMLFDSIIERSSDNVVFYRSFKSNQKHRVGMRLRKTRFILPGFHSSFSGNLGYEDERFLADIDKAFHYLHGGSGEYDGVVQALRKHGLGTGDRITSRYFEFRHYSAGTIHFYPKTEEVVGKMNRFVGRIRQWLPGDMREANADFIQQYEKGESLSKEYLDYYAKSATRYLRSKHPARLVLKALVGSIEDVGQDLQTLDVAIERVHAERGLHCGAAIASSAEVSAIGSQPENQSPTTQEQLLLLTV